MKILFVSPSYKPAYIYGGPAVSVSELAEALVAAGHSVTVYTTTANGREELKIKPNTAHDVNGVAVYYFSRQTGDHTHISFPLWRRLWLRAGTYDIIHLQSWWSMLILGTAAVCRLKGLNYIVSPRGMLSAYSFTWQNSRFKNLVHRTIGLSLLRKSYLHATTSLEWNDCLRVNKTWKGFILPNIVRFPRITEKKSFSRNENEPLIFGFLSRIDQKKGVELLLQALSKVSFPFILKMAGTGEQAYLHSLKKLALELGLSSRVEWLGWQGGEMKFEFFQSIHVFVLTSYNENFANAVIESLVGGTPVFLSEGVGLANYVTENGLGWVCGREVASVLEGLNKVFSEQDKIVLINKRSPELIQKDFSKSALAHEYVRAYSRYK